MTTPSTSSGSGGSSTSSSSSGSSNPSAPSIVNASSSSASSAGPSPSLVPSGKANAVSIAKAEMQLDVRAFNSGLAGNEFFKGINEPFFKHIAPAKKPMRAGNKQFKAKTSALFKNPDAAGHGVIQKDAQEKKPGAPYDESKIAERAKKFLLNGSFD